MQFSLLNFLTGLPQLNALANGTVAETDAGQNPDAGLFSDLLGGDTQQGKGQKGGDLASELVANITAAQDLSATDHRLDVDKVRGLLSHRITPEEARNLLAQMDSDTSHDAPEQLHDLLEAIDAGGDSMSVQDMLSQLPPSSDGEGQEVRANTLQRMMQWLQHALNPHAVSMEALALANNAAMFQDVEDSQVFQAQRSEEKERTKEAGVMIPQWVRQIGEQELPSVELPTATVQAAPVEEGDIAVSDTDDLVLVSTKRNADAAQVTLPAQAASGNKDIFEDFLKDMDADVSADMTPDDVQALAKHQGDTPDTAPPVNSASAQNANDARVAETVRVHHANLAYARGEVMEQVHVGIKHAVRDGMDRITIQLNPSDLGRVEVKMDVAADGLSHVSFLVDKQDTFDLLQRDARTLERMLQEAGVRADAGSMQFNLRQENQSKEPWAEADGDGSDRGGESEVSHVSSNELPTSTYVHLVSDRLDIRA